MKKVFLLVLALLLVSCPLFLTSCLVDEVQCIDIRLTSEQYAFALNKEDTEILEAVNNVLDKITKDGTLEAIKDKYFSENESEYIRVTPGVENPTKKQLIVATHTPFHPFEFSKYETGHGKLYSGIDIEIAYLVAQELEAELIIKERPFETILDDIESGLAHIAASGISITESRQEKVTFSLPYYEASQVIIVRATDNTFRQCKTKADVEAVLAQKGADTVAGFQNNTTSGLYITGDENLGFNGYAITPKGYASAILATQALINGEVQMVIVDERHAKIIVSDINYN